ncbi:hypothetical protein [Duganella vulcania]|uniref:Uncharacterized protein n=1 Tax=Duganella vulcania TaxID=2692166 RepID=A0A845GHA0_9BURK|nr:hypothetical protein [Duganella vulcania]MYM92388.1 hypothetical protein [Duganella vulcania]
MDQKFVELAQSWEALNRAISTMLVAQPAKLSAAADAVEVARKNHEALFQTYAHSQLLPK